MALDALTYNMAKKALKKAGFVGTKTVDETNIKDGDVIQYSKELGKYVTKEFKVKINQWEQNHSYEKNEMVILDDILYWVVVENYVSDVLKIENDVDQGKVIVLAGGGGTTGVGNVSLLDYKISLEGRQLDLSWENPNADSYEGREVYFSETIDITTLKYEEIKNNTTPDDIKLASSGIGTGMGLADSIQIQINTRHIIYVKVFISHYIDGEIKMSSGRYLKADNPDIYPPQKPLNFLINMVGVDAVLSWDQPTDIDFLHTRIIRSTNGFPKTPTDGIVLGSVSGIGEYIDKALQQNITYYYKLFSYDDAGNGFETGVEGNWKSDSTCELSILNKAAENITSLTGTPSNNGTELLIGWTNPIETTYESSEVFVSETDMQLNTYEECVEQFDLGSLYYVNSGVSTSVTYDCETRKKYYVKVFAKHLMYGQYKYSDGVSILVENPDIYPTTSPTNLQLKYLQGVSTLTWTQPTDVDFLSTKVVRSTTQMPIDPTDGTVLGSVSDTGTISDSTVQIGETYYYKLFAYDDAGNGYETGVLGNWVSSAEAEISTAINATYGINLITGERIDGSIGMAQSDFEHTYPWSNISRAVVSVNGDVLYYLDEDNSNLKDDGITSAVLDGTDGNIMVEYPEFYYSYIDRIVKISQQEFTDAKFSPRTLVGAFEATSTLTGNLRSIAGVKPLTGKSISEYRLMSSNIGTGWQQKDIEFLDVLKLLFLVEYGDFNSQLLVGQGIVNTTTEAITGDTISLGNKTGVGTNGSISYRGLENPWGNTWEFIEGLVATDTSYYTANSGYDSFASDVSVGTYVTTGQTPIIEDGFISKLDDNGLLIGTKTQGNNVDYVGDYQFSHKQGEINIAVHGGNYEDGLNAGLFRTHMGLKPFGKEDSMVKISEFRQYTGFNIEVIHQSSGIIVKETENATMYRVSIPNGLNLEEVNSINKIDIL